jgi:hypothetical protein
MIIVQDYMQEVIDESYKRWAWTKMYGSAFGPQSFLYQLFEFFSYHPSRISFTLPPEFPFLSLERKFGFYEPNFWLFGK